MLPYPVTVTIRTIKYHRNIYIYINTLRIVPTVGGGASQKIPSLLESGHGTCMCNVTSRVSPHHSGTIPTPAARLDGLQPIALAFHKHQLGQGKIHLEGARDARHPKYQVALEFLCDNHCDFLEHQETRAITPKNEQKHNQKQIQTNTALAKITIYHHQRQKQKQKQQQQ